MIKHPADMTMDELLALRAVNRARGAVMRSFADEAGRVWNVAAGRGEPWVRVYASFDLDRRTLPYISGPGVGGKRRV